jgi:protoheme IX farnesyltransferase
MTMSRRQNATVLLDQDPSLAACPSRLADYATLTKPRITLMVVVTAYIGFAIGDPLDTGWLLLLATLLGTGLCCMGASAFNQVLERDVDALMHRTRNRPLPAGRLNAAQATTLAFILSILGVTILACLANALAAALAAFTILSYALAYTPLKRVTSLSTLVGAVPGAMPPVIGFAAATRSVDTAAFLLFAIMFVWQLPHFLAIAWLYRDDYARAHLPMLPVIHPDGGSTFRQILMTCLALVPLGLLPTALGISGTLYFATALCCGAIFLAFAVALILVPSRQRARSLFFASLVYLPLVMAMMLIDHA